MTETLDQGLSSTEAKRKLASIQEIKELMPIAGADRIELAKVLGWQVVVKKDEFKVGDKCVYFEIDSLLPEKDEFSFLGSVKVNPITAMTEHEQKGYRLRTQKIRGEISQGLIFSFEALPIPAGMTSDEFISLLNSFNEGTDVTELLNVVKWQIPEAKTNFGMASEPFPSEYVSKTDEERIQNEPKDFTLLQGKSYYESTKIDGTSITVIKKDDKIIFATRNTTLKDENLIRDFLTRTGSLAKLEAYPEDVIFQSEFYGQSVQENRLGIVGNRMATFNVIKNGQRLGLLGMLDFIEAVDLELPPIIEIGSSDPTEIATIKAKIKEINKNRPQVNLAKVQRETVPAPVVLLTTKDVNFAYTASELLEQANGLKYLTNGSAQEGIVIRPLADTDQWDPISFKAISNKFLLKYE